MRVAHSTARKHRTRIRAHNLRPLYATLPLIVYTIITELCEYVVHRGFGFQLEPALLSPPLSLTPDKLFQEVELLMLYKAIVDNGPDLFSVHGVDIEARFR